MTAQEIQYETVSRVLETWDSARRSYKDKDFEAEFGKLIIDKFVELQPRAKKFYQSDSMMTRHAESIVHLLVRLHTYCSIHGGCPILYPSAHKQLVSHV